MKNTRGLAVIATLACGAQLFGQGTGVNLEQPAPEALLHGASRGNITAFSQGLASMHLPAGLVLEGAVLHYVLKLVLERRYLFADAATGSAAWMR